MRDPAGAFVEQKDRMSGNSDDTAAAASRSGLQRLGLGTVQFGLDYGISNEMGQTHEAEVAKILAEANRLGLRLLDTAPSYGEAEQVLGRALPAGCRFDIVTKTRRGTAATVMDDFDRSCRSLQRSNLYGLLVHRAEDLLGDEGDRLMDRLTQLKQSERVRKIGVSVYTEGQIDAILDRFTIDLIQLPVNVFDQRLIRSGHLCRLKQAGVEIHARSVFLQGLLLMAADRLPSHFKGIRATVRAYHDTLAAHGLSPAAGALGFVRSVGELDVILIGVNSLDHFNENVSAFQAEARIDYSGFAIADELIVNPQNWVVA